ncbi:MAG TPA: FMN-binding glutamate synthase family protein, partial [Chitinophagales bacterium]|nr:FMN-binding glutamate synthase family protein [Chitinophagales bacterium]
SAFFAVIILVLLLFYPVYTILVLTVIVFFVGVYDMTQKKHAILRNYPVIGHFRYLLESIGPEIRQYFVESDIDGKPLNRNQRTYIYTRAKLENQMHPFGTEHNLQQEHMEWAAHSIYPATALKEAPRVIIGGRQCKQPYSASIFNISAMSFGSLSKNAIMALNLGAKAGDFYHNTGEGSVSPFHLKGGDLVYQIGTGYFGCRDENGDFSSENFKITAAHPEVKMIEIKLSQGAKPGHGGILPAAKNNAETAAIRGLVPHTVVVSPPAHRAFSTPEGLLQLIQNMRELSGGKPVGFKLCVGNKAEFIEICEAILKTGIYPDFITVDGAEGSTGAAPIVFSDHVGMPFENALVFVIDTLKFYNLKNEIKVIASGKIIDGFDILKTLCLGADLCNSARGMMVAIGCIQALECHLNTCPTGVATNDPKKMRGLVVSEKWQRVTNYHEQTLLDFIDLFAAIGCSEVHQLNRSLIFKQIKGQAVCFAEIYPEVVPNL